MGLALLTALAAVAAPSAGRAQSPEPQPEATPIPIRNDAPPTEPARPVAPASTQALNWIPGSGNLPVNGSQVSTRASSTIALDTSYHKFVLADANGSFSAAQDAVATYSNSNQNVLLVANLPAGNWSRIVFQIKDTSSSAVIESPNYSIGRLIYLPLVMKDYSYPPTNLDAAEPNNSPCSAVGPLVNGKTYSGSFGGSDLDDWYYVEAAQGSSLNVTVSGLATPNQLQVFYVPSRDCNQVSGIPNQKLDNLSNPVLPLPGLPDARIFIRFAGVSGSTPSAAFQIRVDGNISEGTFEDNDNPCQATPIAQNVTYTSFSDDQYDFYRLDVPAEGNVSVNVAEYPVADQIQLRKATGCEQANANDRLQFEPVVSGAAVVWQKLPAGTYYARIGPTAAPNGKPYKIAWRILTTWNPKIDYCVNIGACTGNPSGNTVTAYWNGMGTSTALSFRLEGRTAPRGCPPGISTSTQTPAITPTGSYTFGGVTVGYYAMVGEARGPNGEKFRDEKPIKSGCDFAAAASESAFEPAPFIGPTPAP